MKILVFSDSHRDRERMLDVLTQNKGDYSYVLHLGDYAEDAAYVDRFIGPVPMLRIAGNCDFPVIDPYVYDEKVIELCGKRIFLCHGHKYLVKNTYDNLRFAARNNACSIALFGHTHMPYLETQDNITLFNPGSIGSPRHGKPSYGIIEITEEFTSFETVEV